MIGVESVDYAAVPTLKFRARAEESTGREVYTIALVAQVQIDPARRSYDPQTRELLVDLFGAPERWSATTRSFSWTRVDVLVPGFIGSVEFDIQILCNYDLEIAATKYFYSLPGGEVPLSFHFSGSIFYRSEEDRLQLIQVPWSSSTRFGMPVEVWKRMIRHHYPVSGWVRLHTDTLDALQRQKALRGLPSFDACVGELLEAATLEDQTTGTGQPAGGEAP